MGCQTCRPSLSSTKARVETARGRTRTTPRMRPGIGAVRSSMRIVNPSPSHSSEEGPTAKWFGPRSTEPRRRSVIAQRRGAP